MLLGEFQDAAVEVAEADQVLQVFHGPLLASLVVHLNVRYVSVERKSCLISGCTYAIDGSPGVTPRGGWDLKSRRFESIFNRVRGGEIVVAIRGL